MKLSWLIPALIFILFVKFSLEKFDNTMRDQDARALFTEATKVIMQTQKLLFYLQSKN